MHRASSYDSLKAVAEFIDHGADVNASNEEGRTPLHDLRDVAELLLANGAAVNAEDEDGNIALDSAAEDGYKDIVELLKKHGAKE